MKYFLPSLIACVFFCTKFASAADPFPIQALPGTEIGDSLPIDYEPSGAVWHTGIDKLMIVSDSGLVAIMNNDGSS